MSEINKNKTKPKKVGTVDNTKYTKKLNRIWKMG